MKVFISYATEDMAVAGTLYRKLSAAGAFVFQFGESETVGKSTWDQILASIRECDVFLLLVSSHSTHSRPVKEELDHAHYSHINTDEKNPSRLIPAIIERGVEPPPLIQHFTRFDLTSLETGVPRLLKQLGLAKASAGTPSSGPGSASLPDLDKLFEQYLRKNPQPSVASLWSEKAEKIVGNYHRLKPEEISPAIESSHLKTILRAQTVGGSKSPGTTPFAKYDDLLLGKLGAPESRGESGSTAKLAELLLEYDPEELSLTGPLRVPEVTATADGFEWKAVPGASAYAVQRSPTDAFWVPAEVYRGPETSFRLGGDVSSRGYYRVKAVSGTLRRDSAWSPVIRNVSILEPPTLVGPELPAPTLRVNSSPFGTVLTWTTVEHAFGYVLQRSGASGEGWRLLYEGGDTTYTDFPEVSGKRTLPPLFESLRPAARFASNPLLSHSDPADQFDASLTDLPRADEAPGRRSYRVKAKDILGRPGSGWSNVVVAGGKAG